MRLVVQEIAGENAITRDTGRALYNRIHPALLAGEEVELDFSGVRVFASPFFNTAIGLLYQDMTPEQLTEHLKLQHLTLAGKSTLRVVIETARTVYGSDEAEKAFQVAIREELLADA